MTCHRCAKPLRGPNHAHISIPATALAVERDRPEYRFIYQSDSPGEDVLCRSCCGDVLLALTQALVADEEKQALAVA